MTKLQQEIKSEISYVGQTDEDLNDDAFRISQIAMRWIERAYKADRETYVEEAFKEWCNKNGLLRP